MSDFYAEICDLIHAGHNKGSNDPEVTLNRVFHKIMRISLGLKAPIPAISRKNLSITMETRRVADVKAICNRPPLDLSNSKYPVGSTKRFKSKVRKTKHIPVIIARYAGREFLIDGSRRVRYMVEVGQESLQAYVCQIN